MTLRLWALCFAFAWLLPGCASPPTEAEVKLELRRAASGVQGLGRNPRFVVLNAQTRVDAWFQVASSASEGPSVRAQAVGRDFKKGVRQRVGVVIGGPQAEYVDRFVADSFESSGTDRLAGLTVVVVSPQPPAEVVQQVARKRGAKLVHRQFRR